MNDKPAFGFNDLSDFKPKPRPFKTKTLSDEANAVDSVGKDLGFTQREAPVERRRKKGVTKPTDQFNLRAHIEDINKFVEYAESTNKSYREVFAELIELLPEG